MRAAWPERGGDWSSVSSWCEQRMLMLAVRYGEVVCKPRRVRVDPCGGVFGARGASGAIFAGRPICLSHGNACVGVTGTRLHVDGGVKVSGKGSI